MNIWKIIGAGIIAVSLLALSGCSTTEGIGEDVEEIGEEIKDEVDDHT